MADEIVIEEGDIQTAPVAEAVRPKIGEPKEEVSASLREARSLIPVGAGGATPMTLTQQIDYAQVMVKAVSSLPKHLRGNVGDCLAVIDIATRAGLSPYMVAGKTYVQNDKLCFESQLYHAFVQTSGLLIGDLELDYEGEGEETICTVSGRLRASPEKKRVHKSVTLKEARPRRNDQGVVKGSPLWDKKPRVQLAYDTMRDWVRLYAPTATLGIYTPDEMEEYGPDSARDVTPRAGVVARIGAAERGAEGFRDGHAEAELANLAPAAGDRKIEPAAEAKADVPRETVNAEAGKDTKAKPAKEKAAKATPAAKETAPEGQAKQDAPKAAEAPKDAQAPAPEAKAAEPQGQAPNADPKAAAGAQADAKAQAGKPDKPPADDKPAEPKTWQEYEAAWEAKIKTTKDVRIVDHWKKDRTAREQLKMPPERVSRLREMVDKKGADLKGPMQLA